MFLTADRGGDRSAALISDRRSHVWVCRGESMNHQRLVRPVIVSGLLLLPAVAWAQVSDTAAIAGVVRDTSGAVLPGVTVEAASPALIDKIRTVSTDSQGLYRIVDLRPGLYTVTFTLPSFGTVRGRAANRQSSTSPD